ncbi:hypothetical protein [Pseudonocardia sp.]|uniref:hypothetical protein n=1 Tax=Pseudonocardia sp. TaxID=60912 RepID=UPI00261B735C|nr:hypothetical protein [Pseudonocardia sp.]MCW2720225.1 hypothetical protein [Pseudonocardia sp.]
MYGKFGSTALTAMPVGVVVVGGLEVLWYVVAGCTLLAAAFALGRLLPRRRR